MNKLRMCTRLTVKYRQLNVTSQVSPRHIHRYVGPVLIELTRRKRKLLEDNKQIDNPRNKYLEWNRNAELYAFNKRLSEKFDMELLDQAFTFRSYILQEEEEQKKVGIENPELDIQDNLELIDEGKEIVPLVIENYLYQALPLAPRECIYALKNYLLSTPVLAKASSGIGTKDLILSTEHPVKEETLVNTFYALISALNRSVDLEHASVFIRDILISILVEKDLLEIWCPEDPVEILNDILDRENRELAESRIIAQTGVNTLIPVYQIGIYSNKEFLGSGIGDSVEEGEKLAAINALFKMFEISDSSKPIKCNLKINDSNEKNMPLEKWSRIKM